MYQGRHCNVSDYQYLEKITHRFLSIINRDNFDIKELDNYLNTFSDFDLEISSKIRINLEKISLDKDKYLLKISNLLEELKNNVLVDIKEHN